MGIVLRLELSTQSPGPLRVRVQGEGDGLDYGWVRLDELAHLIAAVASPEIGVEKPLNDELAALADGQDNPAPRR